MTDTKTGYEERIGQIAQSLIDAAMSAGCSVSFPQFLEFRKILLAAFPDRPTVAWRIEYEWRDVVLGEWCKTVVFRLSQEAVDKFENDFLKCSGKSYRNITVTELCEKGSTL